MRSKHQELDFIVKWLCHFYVISKVHSYNFVYTCLVTVLCSLPASKVHQAHHACGNFSKGGVFIRLQHCFV